MTLHRELQATARRLKLAAAQRNRLQAEQARTDMRASVRARRERTCHLIQLGGLVQKAGVVELVEDDRATLLGAFLEIAERRRGADAAGAPDDAGSAAVDPAHLAARWRRRGLNAFDTDKQAAVSGDRNEGRLP
ncbi:MAG: conjugal transfer protein TraD [Terriglobales bacterium]